MDIMNPKYPYFSIEKLWDLYEAAIDEIGTGGRNERYAAQSKYDDLNR